MYHARHILIAAGLITLLFCGDEIEERKRKEKERLENMSDIERLLELQRSINIRRYKNI